MCPPTQCKQVCTGRQVAAKVGNTTHDGSIATSVTGSRPTGSLTVDYATTTAMSR